MKRILVITMAIICSGVFSSIVAKPKGKMTKKETQAKRDTLYDGFEIDPAIRQFPCMEESYDTMEEFRAVGIAEGHTQEIAKSKAVRYAINQIIEKKPRRIISVTSADSSSSETIVEAPMITEEQQQALNNSEIICLKFSITPSRTYIAYVAVRVLKSNLEKNDSIDQKELLQYVDDTMYKEEMRKKFEQYMQYKKNQQME